MTAPMPHVWTADEYDRLPESDNVRRELVDGVLWVAPGPRDLHQILVARLCVALHDSAPRDQYRVTQGVEVKLGELLRYIPDVVAMTTKVTPRITRALPKSCIAGNIAPDTSETQHAHLRVLLPE